jgi:signal transduction histidine kinase
MSILAPEQFTSAVAPVDATPERVASPPIRLPHRQFGLAGRLLALTITAVVLAIGIFYVTRLSSSRENLLRGRLLAVQTVATVFVSDSPSPSPELSRKILDATGARTIILSTPQHRIVIDDPNQSDDADYRFDNTDPSMWEGVKAAFITMFAAPGSSLLVSGPGPTPGSEIEVLFDQTPLIDQMWHVSRNFLALSVLVSAALMLVLWAALWRLVIRPVTRLTDNIVAFGVNPQDVGRVMTPCGRNDEIGRAELALSTMQSTLVHELSQRKRLAELGMAVARINHDLRNMLATAQLISDRFATIADPLAQRLAPQLVATLDRAIDFCQSTLTYGAVRERAPLRKAFDLRQLAREIVETAEAAGSGTIAFAIDIPPNFEVFADRDHMRRVVENLVRNASQALARSDDGSHPCAIRFAAIRTSDRDALIEISDSGPGFAAGAEDHIFEPFHGTTHEGGSGLGLAIAGDLVLRNGGAIRLAPTSPEDFYRGARFLITLPVLRGDHRPTKRVESA